jgi:hypothetical protein
MHLITQPVNVLPCSNSAMKGNNGTNRILLRIDPLLGKDLERNNETTAVATQWHGKHASTTI